MTDITKWLSEDEDGPVAKLNRMADRLAAEREKNAELANVLEAYVAHSDDDNSEPFGCDECAKILRKAKASLAKLREGK